MDIYIVKDNLINNLCTSIIPHILDGFTSIYEDALRANPRNPLEQNKRYLMDIKNWPEHIIANETKRIVSQFKILRQVLKTINYINIKSLALIGKNSIKLDDNYVSKNTPSNEVFVHKIYINSAKECFHDDVLMNFKVTGTRQRQYKVIENVIIQFLNEIVPMIDLLSTIEDDDTDVAENISILDEDPDQTITIENTNTKTETFDKDESIDIMEDSVLDTDIDDTDVVKDDGSSYADFVNKTSMDLLKSKILEDSETKEKEKEEPVLQTTPSSTGKSQTVMLQPSFINEEKHKIQDSSKNSRPMISLREKSKKKIKEEKKNT